MRTKVKMPKVGETAEVVVVLEWHVEVGSVVSESDPLLAVETDKVDTEVPAPISGKIVELLVEPQDEVGVGQPICVMETT